MNLVLATQPAFLSYHFARVRRHLEGEVVVGRGQGVSQGVIFENGPLSTGVGQAKTTRSSALASKWRKVLNTLLTLIIGVSAVVAGTIFVPAAYYQFFPADIIPVAAIEEGTAFGGDFGAGSKPELKEQYLPPYDETLPEGDWLIIPRIGVRTQLQKTPTPEEALQKGVWWVPDFGGPGDEELPMILAAHRYGWQWWWQTDYWRYHSFYNLPETQPGDQIEIISGQRKWKYEIYAGEEGEEITDYSADIILYTCKFLNSPIRHFRYARLIDPTKDTQS